MSGPSSSFPVFLGGKFKPDAVIRPRGLELVSADIALWGLAALCSKSPSFVMLITRVTMEFPNQD